jgi:hypothetical protein
MRAANHPLIREAIILHNRKPALHAPSGVILLTCQAINVAA